MASNSNAAPRPTVQPVREKRMTLASVSTGRIAAPVRVLLYGQEGIGKSTWAASSPSPIYLCAEDGTNALDVARFPRPTNWHDVFDALVVLADEEHSYQTLVIDTLDAIEPLCWDFICTRDHQRSIEAYDYGRGYTAAIDEWRRLLSELERLQRLKNMNLILLAHSQIRTFKSPDTENFDRYELKLHQKAGGLLREWVDAVLFAHYETFALKDDKKGTVKGVSSGNRIIHTVRTAAWDGKNRYSLPESLALDWEDFAAAVVNHQPAAPSKLRDAIAASLSVLNDAALAEKVATALTKAGDDAIALSRIANKLSARVSAQGA